MNMNLTEETSHSPNVPDGKALAEARGSASEPIRHSFSEEELRDAATAWMRKNREKGYEPNTDRYHEKLGLLVDFVTDLLQNEKGEPLFGKDAKPQ